MKNLTLLILIFCFIYVSAVPNLMSGVFLSAMPGLQGAIGGTSRCSYKEDCMRKEVRTYIRTSKTNIPCAIASEIIRITSSESVVNSPGGPTADQRTMPSEFTCDDGAGIKAYCLAAKTCECHPNVQWCDLVDGLVASSKCADYTTDAGNAEDEVDGCDGNPPTIQRQARNPFRHIKPPMVG